MLLEENLKRRILDILYESDIGLTVSEIARSLRISRPTVYKYLSELKAEGKVKEFSVGAYRIYVPTYKFESTRKLISKKLLCALAHATIKVFGDRSVDIGYELGINLVKSFFELYGDHERQLRKLRLNVFEQIRVILQLFLEEELLTDVIVLDDNRCVIRIDGEICPENATKILMQFLKGAIKKFVELAAAKKLRFGAERIVQKEETNSFEITLELILE